MSTERKHEITHPVGQLVVPTMIQRYELARRSAFTGDNPPAVCRSCATVGHTTRCPAIIGRDLRMRQLNGDLRSELYPV